MLRQALHRHFPNSNKPNLPQVNDTQSQKDTPHPTPSLHPRFEEPRRLRDRRGACVRGCDDHVASRFDVPWLCPSVSNTIDARGRRGVHCKGFCCKDARGLHDGVDGRWRRSLLLDEARHRHNRRMVFTSEELHCREALMEACGICSTEEQGKGKRSRCAKWLWMRCHKR